MDARSFYNKFTKAFNEKTVHDNGKTYLEIYQEDEKTFTKIINKIVLPRIIESQGLKSQNEYFRIDTIGWEPKCETISQELAKSLGMSRHLWNLKIAVEHENDKSDWTDELIKLAHIRCPLKVVIGYVHYDERNDIEVNKLEYAYHCLRKTDAFDLSANEELLIILGNGTPRKKGYPSYTEFGYRPYLLSKEKEGFIPMV